MSRSLIKQARKAIEEKKWNQLCELTRGSSRLCSWLMDEIPKIEGVDRRIIRDICMRKTHVKEIINPDKLRSIRSCSQIEKLLNEDPSVVYMTTSFGMNIMHVAAGLPTLDVLVFLVQKLGTELLLKSNITGYRPIDKIAERAASHGGAIADIVILHPHLTNHFDEEALDGILPHLQREELRLVKNCFEELGNELSLPTLMLGIITQQSSLYLYGVSNAHENILY